MRRAEPSYGSLGQIYTPNCRVKRNPKRMSFLSVLYIFSMCLLSVTHVCVNSRSNFGMRNFTFEVIFNFKLHILEKIQPGYQPANPSSPVRSKVRPKRLFHSSSITARLHSRMCMCRNCVCRQIQHALYATRPGSRSVSRGEEGNLP